MNAQSLTKHNGTFLPVLSLCCVAALLLICFSPATGPALAETRYVLPSSEVAVRRGQGTDFKIIAMVKDGSAVELLEAGDDYSRIRLEDDKEGWVLSRFLSVDPPLTDLVAQQRQQLEEASTREAEVVARNTALSEELEQVEVQFRATLTEYDQLKADYEKLRQDTANVIEIKNNLEKTSEENRKIAQQVNSLTQINEKLKKDMTIYWFLAGGGVLLLGFIIGTLAGKSRRRKPSLL